MRAINRLRALDVKNVTSPGRYCDGGGLYLQIANGGKSWVFIYRDRSTRKLRNLGLGNTISVSLSEAREKATAARSLLSSGLDPLADKKAKRTALQKSKTFGVYCEEFLAKSLSGLKNEKHRAQWRSTLRTYCKPIWNTALSRIETRDVYKVLDPIWDEVPETARRLRGRIEHVLSAAKAEKLCDGLNPARWQDNLKPLFKNREAKKARKHHAAMDFEQLPEFMTRLRALDSVSARALELTILCATRTSETRLATWGEVDLEERVWSIPASRMKMREGHEIPLSNRAIAILKAMNPGKKNALIFEGAKTSEPLSNQAMLQCLRGLAEGATVHGMRSALRDWCGDKTSYPKDLAELALAHAIKNKTEAAYRRRKALERRRPMMQDWADFLATPKQTGKVVRVSIQRDFQDATFVS